MSTGLNLWTLLDLVLFTPSKLDFAHRTYWETALLNDILSPQGRSKYDNAVTSLTPPVNVTVGLGIEHLQDLDERYGVMTMHGTLMVSWRDARLRWNSTLYGGINNVAKTRRYLKAANMEPFMPRLYVTEMYARTSDLLQSEPTRINIRSNGQVIVSVRYQIRTTCHLRYDKYPNDEQNCSITIHTPQPISQVNLIMLGTTRRPPLKIGTKTPIYAGQYQLMAVEPKTLYLLPGSFRVENPKIYPSTVVRSVGFLNCLFQRIDVFYTTRMANPVFGLSVLIFLLTLVHSRHVIVWLCFCIVAECLVVSHLVDSLPIDFDSMPAIAWIMTLTMLNTVFVFCWRVLYLYFEQRAQHKWSLQRMDQIEYYYKFAIPIFILYNFYMVYYSFL